VHDLEPLSIEQTAGGSAERAPLEDALAKLAALSRQHRVAEALLQIESLDPHTVLDQVCRLTVDLMPCDRATAYIFSTRARGFIPVADCGTPPHIVQRFAEQYFFGQSRAGGSRTIVPFRDALVAGKIGYVTRDDPPSVERELWKRSSNTPCAWCRCAPARAGRCS
jgi:hypothetical protein